MRPRIHVLLVAAAFVLGQAITAPTPAAGQTESRHPSGLVIVGPVDRQPVRLSEALAKAWSDSLKLSAAHADVLGYPWADRTSGVLVLSVARLSVGRTDGQAIAVRWTLAGEEIGGTKPLSLPAPLVPTSIRKVDRSWAQLEELKHGATSLVEAGIPDANLIYETEPDYQANRIVITIDRLSDRLLGALASRYGTDAIAIRVARRPDTMPQRHADTSPFWGGAQLNAPAGTCTSGFPWADGATNYMLFAGHCAWNGGSVSTPAQAMGFVTPSSRENWSSGVGTVFLDGQSVYRGDIALIEITSGSAGTRIYTGTSGSETNAPVKEMWSRSPANGDQYCLSGSTSGELCGYTVTRTAFDHQYLNGEWVRNITEGQKGDPCTAGGDSGSPTYTVRGDGGIAAKGIHSGGGSFLGTCYEYFTDIWEAFFGFPGTLRIE